MGKLVVYFSILTIMLLILPILFCVKIVDAKVEISTLETFGLNHDEVTKLGSTISYQLTTTECINRGGTPTSLWSKSYATPILNFIRRNGYNSSVYFLGASAEPTAATKSSCVEQTRPASIEQDHCYYRWRFGYFDMESYENEPGTAFFHGMYNYTAFRSRQVLQYYNDVSWYPFVIKAGETYPHGYYNALGIYTSSTSLYNMYFIDGPAIAQDYKPAPLNAYIIICEVQGYLTPVITSTEMPQPTVVPTWKELTWAQQNWWVIFLIVAIIILAILIAIIIYCYYSSIEKKPGPPIYALVLRERVGSPYIIAKENADNSEIQKRVYISSPAPDPALAPEPESEPLRQGRGFNFNPLVNPDPEDMAQNIPVVYNTDGDKLVYNDGDSVADDNENGNRNTNKLFEKAQEHNVQNDEGATQRAPSASGKRHNSRKNKGRASMQTFSEVELPEGEEINEANINL